MFHKSPLNDIDQTKIPKNDNITSGGGNVNFNGDISRSAGIVFGHHITTGDVITEIDQSMKQNPGNEYLQGLKELTEQLSKEYEKYDVPKEKKILINQGIQDLQRDIKDLKSETKAEDLSLSQEKQIEAKTTTLIEKIIDALPPASELITNFTPLSPFSRLIRDGVQKIVDGVKMRRK